ncbi:BTAD domain-containing putative transcriptional regulator [Streptomyces sp. NPDC059917]|uniref:AfsR/SARP family transcriptional regulator n=1 Tax=Streptomyces sp. NPDC059917 TaxID=3347002 RepID=UPI003656C0E2
MATGGGSLLPLGPAKRRSLLAVLLLHPNAPVTMGRLTEALWDEEPPRHCRTMVQGHVSRLRAVLAEHGAQAHGVALVTEGQAYALRLPEALVDAHRFRDLLQASRGHQDPADAVCGLRAALSLWRGPALDGTLPGPLLETAAHTLDELRLTAVEELAAAHGRLGQHATAAAVLRAEAALQPLREPLAAALILALGKAGRTSDALDWYHRTRRLLADQLAVDPGSVLTDAYAALLSADAQASPPVRGAAPGRHQSAQPVPSGSEGTEETSPSCPPPPHTAVPRLLPGRPRGFRGRSRELAAIDRAATGDHGPVIMLTGGAGVGKTALAVRWGHQRSADYPDGCLFADLHGHSTLPERETGAVLRDFLLALGEPADRIPVSPEARGGRYRELTATRRMLVVLDNARDVHRIRPLMPGGAHCVTLVTGRGRLGELVASDAARLVPVGPLTAEDSTVLLSEVLGSGPVDAEPAAAARIVRLCEGLPLALRVAAARVATRPHQGLAAFAGELSDEDSRLDLLTIGDTGVAAALGLTVCHLPEPARYVFHRLGRHTGAVLDTRTAAALADCPPSQASMALDQLAAARLITETSPRAYVLHDLVRLYARTLAPYPSLRHTGTVAGTPAAPRRRTHTRVLLRPANSRGASPYGPRCSCGGPRRGRTGGVTRTAPTGGPCASDARSAYEAPVGTPTPLEGG